MRWKDWGVTESADDEHQSVETECSRHPWVKQIDDECPACWAEENACLRNSEGVY
jgi:hypothetical protein